MDSFLGTNSSQLTNLKEVIIMTEGRAFKFGQTTLDGHALAGEESFAIQWKPDNSVWYILLARSLHA